MSVFKTSRRPRESAKLGRRVSATVVATVLIGIVAGFGIVFSPSETASAFDLFVSPNGNDAWSGTLAEPTADATDGPLATPRGAQAAWRKFLDAENDAKSGSVEPINVWFRAGTWAFDETLELDETDLRAPLSISAFDGEQVRFVGSRVVDGFEPGTGAAGSVGLDRPEIWRARCDFRSPETSIPFQLFGAAPLRRARTPNFDPDDPYRGGFFYVERSVGGESALDGTVSTIHNAGDALFYDVDVPRAGNWFVWVYYGADNSDVEDMGPRVALRCGADDSSPDGWKPIASLPRTDGWEPSRWALGGTFALDAGRRTLGWKNVAGGGCDLGGFVLTDDSDFKPEGTSGFAPTNAEKSVIVVPAVEFAREECKSPTVDRAASPDRFCFKPGELRPEFARPGAELKIYQGASCRAYLEMTTIENVDATSNIVRLGGDELTADLKDGDRYWIENCPKFLDEPGEWFFDAETKTLYVWPPRSETGGEAVPSFRIAVLGTLIRVKKNAPVAQDGETTRITQITQDGETTQITQDDETTQTAENASFRLNGISFAETLGGRDSSCVGYNTGKRGVVELTNVRGAVVENCDFADVGRYAVQIAGGGENVVRRCRLTRGGQGGVAIRAPRNVVEDCSFEDIGLEYKHIAGVLLEDADAFENRVAHNSVRRSSRYGVSLKDVGRGNVVEYNSVVDTSLETYDTGAIEVTQGNPDFLSGGAIRGNYVENCAGYSSDGGETRRMAWGIYLDSFAGGYTVENNFVRDCPNGGFMLQGGKGNVVRNNVFLDSDSVQGYFANYLKNCENLVFERNVVCWKDPEALFFVSCEGIEDALRCDDNLYWRVGNPDLTEAERAWVEAWRGFGFDARSVVADPKIDANGKFAPDSPVFKIGFKPFDAKANAGPRPLEPKKGR